MYSYLEPCWILLTFPVQCLQFVLGIDHACISDAVLGPVRCGDMPGEDQHMHAGPQRCVQGMAGGQDGPYPVRVHFGQQGSRRAPPKGRRETTPTSPAGCPTTATATTTTAPIPPET